METTTTFQLTAEDAQEVAHKIGILGDSTDLQEDYGLTHEQADTLARSVPQNGGEWAVPNWAIAAVRAEMADHILILRDISRDARSGGETGQALRIAKQAKRLETLFAL